MDKMHNLPFINLTLRLICSTAFDHFLKPFVNLINTLISLEVENGYLLHDRIFLLNRHLFKFVYLFLFVPQLAIDFSKLGNNFAEITDYLGNLIAFFFINLVRSKRQMIN